MSGILDPQLTSTEIVLQEKVVTTEFKVVEIHESIKNRFVRAEIELGPFITEDGQGENRTRGTSRRGIVVWENEAYDAIRDHVWTNEDLISIIKTKLV